MKLLFVVLVLGCELMVAGCGSSTSSTSAAAVTSGLWEAVLAGGDGNASGAQLSFITDFTVNGNGSLSVSQFSFNTAPSANSCFVSGESETGSSSLTTNAQGTVTGTITYVITSGQPAGNTLTLNGTENGSSITGNWSMTSSSDCTASGSFTMTKS